MEKYRSLIRRADKEYKQIEHYVMQKALAIMNLEESVYLFAYTRALQQPSMLSKIRGSDESFRKRMWKRISDAESKERLEKMTEEEKKKIYLDMLTL